MVAFPKHRLSSRVLRISLSVALGTVLFYGMTVFVIEFQSSLKDAKNAQIENLASLVASFNKELQRRQGRIRLLTENPQALESAMRTLKKTKTPEVFFGTDVLFYQILSQTQIESGGAAPGEVESLLSGTRHPVLKVVRLSDTATGILADAHAMVNRDVLSIHVMWDVSAMIQEENWFSQNLFQGFALTDEKAELIWKAGTWPDGSFEVLKTGERSREISWDNKTWLEISEDLSIFPDEVRIHAIAPISFLYAQAWRTSSKILFRVCILLGVGLSMVFLLAVSTRHVMKPLEEISLGVRRISEGDLETVLDSGGDDEIAFLAETLNEMTHRLKVKEQSVQAHIQLLKEKNDELLALSEKLKEADRLKDHFLAVLSHELRTPLTAILGYAELSMEGIYGPMTPKQAEIVSFIQSNGNKLLSIMEDLLDIAKIRAGTIEVNAEPFHTADLLADIRRIAENSIRQKPDVRYVENIQDRLPEMVTDRVKLEQILTNLMSNAIKFTERGSVKISVKTAGDSVVFEVEDTGIGIASQHLPRIFDAFTQLDAGIRRKYGGTGLGLTISKSLAEKLGGHINVVSEIGTGSRFTLILPARYRVSSSVPKTEGEGENPKA